MILFIVAINKDDKKFMFSEDCNFTITDEDIEFYIHKFSKTLPEGEYKYKIEIKQ